MNYYKNYRTAELALKIRAIYINNMLSEMELPEELLGYGADPIHVDTDELHMEVTMGKVKLTYYIHYEDYTDNWEVPLELIDKPDEDVKRIFLENIRYDYELAYRRQESQLIDMAKYLGYELVKK